MNNGQKVMKYRIMSQSGRKAFTTSSRHETTSVSNMKHEFKDKS